ncbi:MAG TPA: TspO/MBR family protein [Polyangiaceae bacterium]|nr:TspO/MBR family protein [Polyangiaceae bacterium]
MASSVAAHPPDTTRLSSRRGLALALAAAASVIATSTAGRVVSAPGVRGWYRTIAKPPFNPPNWAFPVAWSLLFVLMGVAFWRVLRAPPRTPGRGAAVALFLAQLVVNVGWSLAFFGAHSPLYGLIVIIPFWLMIAATAAAFRAVDRVAGWLLAPYLAWVSFAAVLNAAIWRLN